MQLKSVLRKMTLCFFGMGLLAGFVVVAPISPVQGFKQTAINTTYQNQNSSSFFPAYLLLEGITETLPTTPSETVSESSVITATAAPTSTVGMSPPETGQAGTITAFTRLVQTKPWIPLGFLLVILLTTLTMLLVNARRKTTGVASTPRASGVTAQLPPTPTPAQDMAFLQLKLQPEITFPLLVDDLTIGRASDNSIVILPHMPGAETVSHYHTRLYHIERWILEDLDSTNGTYVNGQRTGRNYLRNGWEIGIGGVIFVFHTGKVEA